MQSPYKGKTGWGRLVNAWTNSLEGFKATYRLEEAFRQEVWVAIVLLPLAFILERGATGRALLVGSVLFVLIVELLNSAIEAAVDRISLEHHELAKRAKDIASAAVMLSLVNVVAVWLCVLLK